MPTTVHRNQKPYAIVIGLDCITGLQTARLLARRQIPVIAIAKNPEHFCCKTRVCEKILVADTASEAFIQTLARLGSELEQKAVLYPCTDMSVLTLSRNRQRLQPWYHIALPAPEAVEMLMDKIRFYTYAQKEGLPIPGTFFLKNKAEAKEAAERLAFPCILKPPMKTPLWEKNTKSKVFKIASAQEFLELYDRCSEWAEVLMVQEWIEGTDADLYSCNCYFNAAAEPVATFVARKLRQWPPHTGTSCLGEECRNDIVLHETMRLFKSVGYHGLGYVEMKRDARTGKHYIIEPNIGRPTGRSAIAEAGGVELLYAMYCDKLGWPLPANLEQKYIGVKWIYLRRDFQSALYYWKRGELTLRQWWKSFRGRKAYAVFSWTDPVPFWCDIFRTINLVAGNTKADEKTPTEPAPAALPTSPVSLGRANS
ncbi:MAG: carboxylate--amine ligase [candidate division KSB1 bacterium]|nr:carboxylate--amine ligase [candidate division KSB1 bacterium]